MAVDIERVKQEVKEQMRARIMSKPPKEQVSEDVRKTPTTERT